MNKKTNINDPINETQSLLVIREMIQISKNKIKQDGILFIIWGWMLLVKSFYGYIERTVEIPFQVNRILKYLGMAMALGCLGFTIFYLLKQRKKVQTYVGISLRYIWISLFVCMVLINLILFNVLGEIRFELQQPLFMVLMAFAVTITGGILRYRLIIYGGIIFGLLALLASYMNLSIQLLVESIAWTISFIIPGHILYAKREKQ